MTDLAVGHTRWCTRIESWSGGEIGRERRAPARTAWWESRTRATAITEMAAYYMYKRCNWTRPSSYRNRPALPTEPHKP